MGNDTYGILIDPKTYKAELIEFDEGYVNLKTMRNVLRCDYVEYDKLTDELDIWVDEEGLINGSADRNGMFSVSDADGERLGQVAYAGRGLILTSLKIGDEEYPMGMTGKRAMQVLNSLNIGTLI